MNIINLTGHEVHDLVTDTIFPGSKETKLEVEYHNKVGKRLNGIPVYRTELVLKSELPPKLPKTRYIVGALVLKAIPEDRNDFVCPGNVKRNPDQTVKGCWGFRAKE